MKNIKYLAVVFFSATFVIFAQNGNGISSVTDPVSTGMGKTNTVTSRGVYALGVNPSLLTWSKDKSFEFALIAPFNFRFGFDFMTLDDYNYFFKPEKNPVTGKMEGKHLTPEDKQRFRELFSDEAKMVLNLSYSLFSFSYNMGKNAGAIGFSISDNIYSRVVIPETFAKVVLEGGLQNEVYDFSSLDIKGVWARKYSLSYAHDFKLFNWKQVSAGISLNLLQGYAYFGTDYVKTNFMFDNGNVITGTGDYRAVAAFSPLFGVNYDFDSTHNEKGSFSLFPSPAGSGFGVDLGFAARIDNNWSFGFALTDLGSMTWNKGVAEYSAEGDIYVDDILDQTQRDSVVNMLKGKAHSLADFGTSLPGAFRIGGAYNVSGSSGDWVFASDLNFGFNNEPGNSTKPRWSLGVEWNPASSWAPWLRTGFTTGGGDLTGWTFGGGFRLGNFYFDGAMSDFQYFFTPSKAKRASVSLGLRMRFD